MTEGDGGSNLLILLTGVVLVLSLIVRAGLEKIKLPPLVGFLAIGFLLRLADDQWGLLWEGSLGVFHFLAQLGLVTLLFRIGLESNITGLKGQLSRASLLSC